MEIEGIELKVSIVNVPVLFFYRLASPSIWIGRDEEESKNPSKQDSYSGGN